MRGFSIILVLIAGCALAMLPAEARQDDPRLKDLFGELKDATSSLEARVIEAKVWKIWTENGNPRIDALMDRGVNAMSVDDTETALAAFNEVVRLDDSFAEGFNKRATVEFARHDFAASVADIERTLQLEPRHFGALAGLGQVYLAMNKKAAALKAFEAALAIDPKLENVQRTVTELKLQLEGNPT
ncbi:MAG TPA: tetratricopeptide repeat protein [Stellaceae bacterium]|jgi:tetratricopeptide (TPR) repeat protein|nr:tetratricopeptide repeat protein [Stellaceae bacterium]